MNVFIKPRLIDDKPALVRDPTNGKPLLANGEWKTKSQFWVRRIMQGDVIDETAAQTERQKAPAAVKPQPAPDMVADKPQLASPISADKSK
jgi:hypothetical protein